MTKPGQTHKWRRWIAGVVILLGCSVLTWLAVNHGGTVQQDTTLVGDRDENGDRSDADRIVGTSKCAECHSAQWDDYQHSGHARTFWRSGELPIREKFTDLEFRDADRGVEFHYTHGKDGLEVSLPAVFGQSRFPLQFAFGSGEHAVTFVTLIDEFSGEPTGVEHRVSWFTGLDKADLTPGQLGMSIRHEAENFGRVLQGNQLQRCFECHTTSVEIVRDTLAGLQENVGCESCHANAAGHVAAMETGLDTPNLGFSERPWLQNQQIGICGDCHRSVDNVSRSQIVRGNRKIVRYQPVGLVQSKCYQKSAQGQFLCSTCHDPHQHARQRPPQEYERKCLTCHTDNAESTACPVSAESGCIKCHMPRIEIHPSISFHDHWIRVRDDSDPPAINDEDDDSP